MEQNQPQQPPVFSPGQSAQQPSPQFQPRVAATPMMDPVTAVKTCFKKYFDFKGRARRSEFWWFVLFVCVVRWVLSGISWFVPFVGYVSMAFSLLVLIPQLAVLTRRVHDAGHSGWWVALLALFTLGYFGAFAMLVGGNFEMFNNPGDMIQMMETMSEAVQNSPATAMVMMISSLGVLAMLIVNFIFTLQDSQWKTNKYGPSPKYK